MVEAQLEALARVRATPNQSTADTLAAEFDFKAHLDDGIDKQAKESLSSLHGFIESLLNERTDAILDAISKQIQAMDRAIRRDFFTAHEHVDIR